MGVIIEESGIKFGEYDEEDVFCIERCSQYTESLRLNGIKTCEFVLKKNNQLLFIEAKTSCPNQLAAVSPEEKVRKYEEYLNDISFKMRHSIALFSNILLKRYESDGLSATMKNNNLENIDILFVLVVKKAEREWLVPFQDKFKKLLDKDMKIWRIKDFLIITEAEAKKRNLVISP